jgi:hypothetical protein
MTDTLWSRNVRARLVQQYPRVPSDDIDALLRVWLHVLEPELPAGELERAVEDQVRTALKALSSAIPRQRSGDRRASVLR